jgi:hypothetical protein
MTTDSNTAPTPKGGARSPWLWWALAALSAVAWGVALWLRAPAPSSAPPPSPAHATAPTPPQTSPSTPSPAPPLTKPPARAALDAPPPLGALPALCADPTTAALAPTWRAQVSDDARPHWDALALSSGCALAFSDAERDALLRAHAAWILPPAEGRGVPIAPSLLLDLLNDPRAPWPARAAAARTLRARMKARALTADDQAALLQSASTLAHHPWALSALEAAPDAEAAPLLWAAYQRVEAEAHTKPPTPPTPPPKPRAKARPQPFGALAALANASAYTTQAAAALTDALLTAAADADAPPPPPAWTLTPAETLAKLEARMVARWPALPQDARDHLMRRWLDAQWWMQKAGSIGQPQTLLAEVRWRGVAMPPPFTGSALYVRALSVTLEDLQAKKPAPVEVALDGAEARALIGAALLTDPTHWQRTLDLQAVLKAKGAYKVAAALELVVLPPDARDAADVIDPNTGALSDTWRAQALWSRRVELGPFTYKVFLGTDSGEPKTTRDAKLGRALQQRLALTLRAPSGDIPLRADGKAAKHPAKTPYPFTHTPNAALDVSLTSPLEMHLAFRLYGTNPDDPKATAHDLGGGLLLQGETAARWPVNLSAACPAAGACKVNLRLRASLKTARSDPRVDHYWGDPVELGTLLLDVTNSGDGQQWRYLQRRLPDALSPHADPAPTPTPHPDPATSPP